MSCSRTSSAHSPGPVSPCTNCTRSYGYNGVTQFDYYRRAFDYYRRAVDAPHTPAAPAAPAAR
ncbi:hypothetical protein [Streptomyces tubercidicus]|uniref:hypothetical protein n=1 Tax=Streptomyces tubercidicus TaxID=47759 RepID=UPI002E0DD5B7|nr:hypothetical protein OG761_05065 [Streptomyces tubercidicus]